MMSGHYIEKFDTEALRRNIRTIVEIKNRGEKRVLIFLFNIKKCKETRPTYFLIWSICTKQIVEILRF